MSLGLESDLLRLKRPHIPIPERGTYVPGWAPHPESDYDLTRPVLHEGMPQGFVVGDVMPERRWAIDPATGETLRADQFRGQYLKWISHAVNGRGDLVPIAAYHKSFEVDREPIPVVREFISTRGDGTRIGYQPDKPAPRVRGGGVIYDEDGHEMGTLREHRQKLASQSATLRLAEQLEQLAALKAQGVLTAEQHTVAVAKLTQTPDAEPETPPAALAGEIERVDRLLAETEAPSEAMIGQREMERAAARAAAPYREHRCDDCGKVAKSAAGLVSHRRIRHPG